MNSIYSSSLFAIEISTCRNSCGNLQQNNFSAWGCRRKGVRPLFVLLPLLTPWVIQDNGMVYVPRKSDAVYECVLSAASFLCIAPRRPSIFKKPIRQTTRNDTRKIITHTMKAYLV